MAKTNLNSEFIKAALLYRFVEKEDKIPLIVTKTDFEFVDDELSSLAAAGAIEANKSADHWEVTDKGVDLFESMLDSYEALVDLDIFAAVNLSLELPDALFDEDGFVLDEELDPRFEEPGSEAEAEKLGTTDLRLPVIDFLAERASKKSKQDYSPERRHLVLSRMVFLQDLGNDRFASDKAFFDLKLGGINSEINEIVSSVPPWLELAKEHEPPSRLMEMIIESGFRDAMKREMLPQDEDCIWLDPAKQAKVIGQMLEPLAG
jgi:hypothetical protein